MRILSTSLKRLSNWSANTADRIDGTQNFITTVSGRLIWFPDASKSQIDAGDIAHGLSRQSRWVGQIKDSGQLYSIAHHSLNVESLLENLPVKVQIQGLLHDATEAYMCDVPTPLKRLCYRYSEFERRLWTKIAEHCWIDVEMDPAVKFADRIMLLAESVVFKPDLPFGDREQLIREEPMVERALELIEQTRNLSIDDVRVEFLLRLRHLMQQERQP